MVRFFEVVKKNVRLISLISCGLMIVSANAQSAAVQTIFNADHDVVQKPVSLPPDVLRSLSQDKAVRGVLEDQHVAPDDLPQTWFTASRIGLGPRSYDYLVQGIGPLHGANVTSFWIFLTNPRGHRKALDTAALQLKIEDRRTNGYRDITLTSATAEQVSTTQLRFNGHEYVLYRQKDSPAH